MDSKMVKLIAIGVLLGKLLMRMKQHLIWFHVEK